MSKTRKILSIVLAVVMAFSVFSICSFATGETATWTVEATNLDGTALGASIHTGDKVLVTVKLQTNFYVGTVGLPVVFSDAFEYVSGSVNQVAIYGTGATHAAFNDDFDAGIANTNAVYAVYVPNSNPALGAASPMYSTATTILSFQLEAVAEGTADIYIPASMQKTDDNIGGKFYCGSRASSDVATDEDMTGQTFVTTAATATVVIADTVATPELSGVNGGYVDTTNHYVYGIPVGGTVDSYFTCTNGSFTVTGGAKTGATLTVYDSSSNVYETYTVIIFGDVDGNGAVNLADATRVYNSTVGIAISDPAMAFAANVDGNAAVNLADATRVYNATVGIPLSVNPYAA